jgi:hypothetical protein
MDQNAPDFILAATEQPAEPEAPTLPAAFLFPVAPPPVPATKANVIPLCEFYSEDQQSWFITI